VSSGTFVDQYIRTLHIERLFPDDRTPKQILEYTPRLERLTYMFFLDHDFNSDVACIDTQRLTNALSHVRMTLRHLEIGYRVKTRHPRGLNYPPVPPVRHVACNLKHLVTLESLNIPLTVLLGWQLDEALANVLPSGLGTLYLTMPPLQRQWEGRPGFEPMAIMLTPFVEGQMWRRSTPKLKIFRGHMRVDGLFGKAAMVELHRHSVIVKRLLNDNGLDYLEDVKKLGEVNGLFSMPHYGNDEDLRKYKNKEVTWQSLGFES
jgi:hypothetical protein